MISDYGLCTLPVVPMRSTDSHRAEMVSQLLFGESYRVLHATEEWIEIETDFDHYRGFIAANQHENIAASAYDAALKSQTHTATSILHLRDHKRGCRMNIAPASCLRMDTGTDILMGDFRFTLEETLKACSLTEVLRVYEGTPYLWGGRTPWGTDCSGFTQAVFRTQGIDLARDASQQALQGCVVDADHAGFGDLAFFRNAERRITHVGMLLSGDRILHCSGRVRNDRLDARGIFCESSRSYSHELHSIRHIANFITDK